MTRLNEVQFRQVTASVNELRGLKHDINNHLATLSNLLERNEFQEATDYINTIVANIEESCKLISSGNPTIDCIVSNKLLYAQRNGIEIKYIIHIPDEVPITNVDLSSLLGNLFDNAIESCLKMPSSETRFIIFSIKPFNNMLSIKMENSSDGKYHFNSNGDFVSTKSESSGSIKHGIGIKQINKISKKYNGIVRFTPAPNTFTAEILFPLNNPSGTERL